MQDLTLFAVAAPGLETIVADELRSLGFDSRPVDGGAEWSGDIDAVMRANLHARTPSRVLVRVTTFRARTFGELERHARRIDWTRYVDARRPVSLRVTCRKSRLYHEGAVAERIAGAIGEQTGSPWGAAPSDDDDAHDAQLFVIRFVRDVCSISADSSGARLHQRGYRQAVAKAPLRETMAAAMILASGWDGRSPLLDPMCGSGTIPIEAALMARRVAPGLSLRVRSPRSYAFTNWPGLPADSWKRIVDEARAAIADLQPAAIFGADRFSGSIRAAIANAGRAGVADDIVFHRRAVAATVAPAGNGWVVTNPPWGRRVGSGGDAAEARADLDAVIRERLTGWVVARLMPAGRPQRDGRIAFETRSGSIPVRLHVLQA